MTDIWTAVLFVGTALWLAAEVVNHVRSAIKPLNRHYHDELWSLRQQVNSYMLLDADERRLAGVVFRVTHVVYCLVLVVALYCVITTLL